jgi:hypothetical protein
MNLMGVVAAVAALFGFSLWKLGRFLRYSVLPRYSDRKALILHDGPVDVRSPRLGRYYADLHRGLVDATYDEEGVTILGHSDTAFYNPCAVAQSAVLAYEEFLKHRRESSRESLRRQLEWLVAHATATRVGACFYYAYDTHMEKAPWGSGIAQGIAISALLRGYEALGNSTYLELARRAFLQLDAPVDQGGFRHEDAELPLWYEEDNHRGHIVNGHIFALLGVFDFYRVTGELVFRQRFDAGVDSLVRSLPRFDLGFHTAYSLDDRLPANNSYHLIHITLFEVLATITGDARFADAARRFRRYHDSPVFRLRTTARLLLTALGRSGGRSGVFKPFAPRL